MKIVKYLLAGSVAGMIMISTSCSRTEVTEFNGDTTWIQLAEVLAKTDQRYDPEKNSVFASADNFTINAADLVRHYLAIGGKMTVQLSRFDTLQLQDLTRNTVMELAETRLLRNEAEREGFSPDTIGIKIFLDREYMQLGGKENYFKRITKTGISFDYYYDQLCANNAIQQYIQSKLHADSALTFTDSLILCKPEKVTFRHIMLKTRGMNRQEKAKVYSRAQALYKKLENGENFEVLARTYSEDLNTKANGGLMKNVTWGTVDPALETLAFSLVPGVISPITESRYGYHLIETLAREFNDTLTNDLKSRLSQAMIQSAQNQKFDALLRNVSVRYHFKVF